jgi:shikimate dehydrogenase
MTDLPRIPLAGVIGHPVAHSRSPALHGYWLKRYGLKGHYVPIDIAPLDLPELIRTLPRLGFVGLNVTLPHKEAMLQIADIVTDRAALIGAANTLIFRKDGKIHADNTDGSGFIANLRQKAPHWSPAAGPAVILGAGGAARAVVAALIEVGVPEIRIANRTRPRAEAIRSDFGAKVHVQEWDLVYTPLMTQFLTDAEAQGCTVVDGLGMLLHQAAPGFERWFGTRPDVDEATRKAVLSA